MRIAKVTGPDTASNTQHAYPETVSFSRAQRGQKRYSGSLCLMPTVTLYDLRGPSVGRRLRILLHRDRRPYLAE
ncbi:hypothetical protein MATL_G00182040 [Megalops atlanticus]|uniref:Uncharacterized protein n=1 Tax=Megalops atlanticus TaxID=7932 RepID=A0A9D3PPV0_MEGAT|nr:hypothetical protein MATL_G00182040 [Megalops atlanticus]